MVPFPAVQIGTPPAYVMAARKELEEAEGMKETEKVELEEPHVPGGDEGVMEEPNEIVADEAIKKEVKR